jgi:hypothetical protein
MFRKNYYGTKNGGRLLRRKAIMLSVRIMIQENVGHGQEIPVDEMKIFFHNRYIRYLISTTEKCE